MLATDKDTRLTFQHSNMDNSSLNSCISIQQKYPDIVDSLSVQIIFGSLYGLVIILGVTGSIFTAYCVLYNGINVGIHNCFILSLTCSDVIMALLSLPFTAATIFARNWYFGSWGTCKMVPIFQASTMFVSSFTLAAISIDRYRQINAKYISLVAIKNLTWKSRTLVVFGFWVLAIVASVPYAMLVVSQVEYKELCGIFCEEIWPLNHSWRRVFGGATFAIQFVLPLIILVICYGKVEKEVKQSVKRRLNYHVTQDTKERLKERQQKAHTIMVCLFAAFVIPWLPYNMWNVLRDFNMFPQSVEQIIFATVHLIAMTSTMWNPLIYCFLNADFQKTLKCTTTTLIEYEAPLHTQSLKPFRRNLDNGEEFGRPRTSTI